MLSTLEFIDLQPFRVSGHSQFGKGDALIRSKEDFFGQTFDTKEHGFGGFISPFVDDIPGSLRHAVRTANLLPDPLAGEPTHMITLDAGTYVLDRDGTEANPTDGLFGDLDITAQDLVITGAGSGQTIIDATALDDRIFDVHPGAKLRQGQSDGEVLARIAGSPEGFYNGGNTNDRWLRSQYVNILGRDADDGGLSYFQSVLLRGYAEQREAVATVMATSRGYQGHTTHDFYTTLLGRSAAGGEVDYWVGLRQQGLTEEQVLTQVVASGEYFGRAGGSNGVWLDRVYQDLLDRQRDLGAEGFLR